MGHTTNWIFTFEHAQSYCHSLGTNSALVQHPLFYRLGIWGTKKGDMLKGGPWGRQTPWGGRLGGVTDCWSQPLSPVPPMVFWTLAMSLSRLKSACQAHGSHSFPFWFLLSLLLIASGPLSHLVFCFLIQGIPLPSHWPSTALLFLSSPEKCPEKMEQGSWKASISVMNSLMSTARHIYIEICTQKQHYKGKVFFFFF